MKYSNESYEWEPARAGQALAERRRPRNRIADVAPLPPPRLDRNKVGGNGQKMLTLFRNSGARVEQRYASAKEEVPLPSKARGGGTISDARCSGATRTSPDCSVSIRLALGWAWAPVRARREPATTRARCDGAGRAPSRSSGARTPWNADGTASTGARVASTDLQLLELAERARRRAGTREGVARVGRGPRGAGRRDDTTRGGASA